MGVACSSSSSTRNQRWNKRNSCVNTKVNSSKVEFIFINIKNVLSLFIVQFIVFIVLARACRMRNKLQLCSDKEAACVLLGIASCKILCASIFKSREVNQYYLRWVREIKIITIHSEIQFYTFSKRTQSYTNNNLRCL